MKITLAVFVSIWLSAGQVWAGLGLQRQSVVNDQQRMHGQLRTIANDGYSVQQIEAADGTMVREYVSSEGMVFGVAWQGQKLPDLSALLGDYFPLYQAALPVPVHRRTPVSVHTAGLVVEISGGMRSFYGRAYLPDRVPSALALEAIQ
jgi:hypothetical protein